MSCVTAHRNTYKWTTRKVSLQSCLPLWTFDDVLEVRGRAGEQQCDHDNGNGGISGWFAGGRHSDRGPIVEDKFGFEMSDDRSR